VTARLVVLLTLGLCLLPAPGAAQDLDVSASLHPPGGRVGEEMVLTVVVAGAFRSVSDPRLPGLGGAFDAYSAGTSRSVSIVNGRTTSSYTARYRLVPRRAGTFTIGAIEVEHEGTVYRTKPIPVTVEAGTAPDPLPGEPSGRAMGTRDLFLRAVVDRRDPYLFEQVTYRLLFYRRVALIDDPSLTAPPIQGFWKEDIPSRRIFDEVVDGETYRVTELVFALFPTTPGKLTIGEAVLECLVRVRRDNRDPFSMFGGGVFDGKRVVLRSDPVTVNVKRLPPDAPPGFTGAVGDFVLAAEVDKTELNQDEPVTVRIEVSGNGNLKTIGDLALPELPDFRSYPQADSREVTTDGFVLGGRYRREFVLVPLSAGEKTVPPIELVTFSPRAGVYRVLETPPMTLRVTPGSGRPGTGPTPGRGGIEVVGRDIRFIETEVPEFTAPGAVWDGVRTVLLALPLPAVGFLGVWFTERRRRRLGDDVALRRRSGAAKRARGALRRARGTGGPTARAAAAADALRTYLADRWNVPPASVTAELVADRLRAEGVDAGEIVRLLERTDAARFAPERAFSGDGDPVDEAASWVLRLEKTR
jgi:hypothetical protein